MNTLDVMTATVGLAIAGIIKGATGLGFASCALPFLVLAIGLKPAMALVIVPAMATNLGVLISAGNVRETIVRFKWLYLSMLVGVPVGVLVLEVIDQIVAVRLLGCVMILYALLAWWKPALHLSARLEQYLQLPTGFLNGIVTGLTGAQVMPLFPYVMSLRLDAARTVQTVNIAVLVGSSLLGLGLAVSGVLTRELLGMSLLAVAPSLIGVSLGNFIRDRLNDVQFRRIVIGVLFTIGLTMLVR
jgi:uncharacterized membrane protein YfcA